MNQTLELIRRFYDPGVPVDLEHHAECERKGAVVIADARRRFDEFIKQGGE